MPFGFCSSFMSINLVHFVNKLLLTVLITVKYWFLSFRKWLFYFVFKEILTFTVSTVWVTEISNTYKMKSINWWNLWLFSRLSFLASSSTWEFSHDLNLFFKIFFIKHLWRHLIDTYNKTQNHDNVTCHTIFTYLNLELLFKSYI